MSKFTKGAKVVFLGFAGEDKPDNAELLKKGQTYTIADIKEGNADVETAYILEVSNPDFNPKKKASKTNKETLEMDVFEDEIKLAKEAKTSAKGKATSKTSKKTTTKKTSGKKKVSAKEEQEDEETSSKKEVDDDLKDMIILTAEEDDAEILELIESSDDICELVQEIAEESAATDYRLGGVLYHVRIGHAYRELDPSYKGKGGWQKYIDENLNISYRKAQYLMDIYAKFNKYGISGDKVAELGWSKCSMIARVMTEENAEELVELAEEETVEGIKDTIKEDYTEVGGTKGDKVKRITFKFRLVEDSAQTIRNYVEQAKDHLGLPDDNAVFEAVMTEWAMQNLNVKARKQSSTKAATSKKTVTKKKVAVKKKAKTKKK